MANTFIHNQEKNKPINSNNKYYSIIGYQDFIDEENNPRLNIETNDKVLCKIKYKDNGIPKYLIKIDNSKKLFNPLSSNEELAKNKSLDLVANNTIAFKEVSKKVFDLYLSFLRTSNILWINHAEREDF